MPLAVYLLSQNGSRQGAHFTGLICVPTVSVASMSGAEQLAAAAAAVNEAVSAAPVCFATPVPDANDDHDDESEADESPTDDASAPLPRQLTAAVAVQMQPGGQLVMLRHGESEANANGQLSGWQDSDLTQLGRQQACMVARRLREIGWTPQVAFTSLLQRAWKTCRIVCSAELRDTPDADLQVGV